MRAFLTHAQWLKDWALEHERLLWHVVPKHHMALHMAEGMRLLESTVCLDI